MNEVLAAVAAHLIRRGLTVQVDAGAEDGLGRGVAESLTLKARWPNKRKWGMVVIRFSSEHSHEQVDKFPLLPLDRAESWDDRESGLFFFVSSGRDQAFVITPSNHKDVLTMHQHKDPDTGETARLVVIPRKHWKSIKL